MNLKNKIKNSIRAYIMADAMGVPFEFKTEGTFNCNTFAEGGFHHQLKGTWSDDSSVLLCLINAFSNDYNIDYQFELFTANIKKWFFRQDFSADDEGWFDIGDQTRTSILLNRDCAWETESMGNGALFYTLPIAIIFGDPAYHETSVRYAFEYFCKYTHNNKNCFEFGSRFCLLIRKLLLDLPIENINVSEYENRGDVINTYNLVIDNFLSLVNQPSTLFADICKVVNLGKDTDTNAALFAALMGTKKKVDENDWKQVRRYEYIDRCIDTFLNSLEILK